MKNIRLTIHLKNVTKTQQDGVVKRFDTKTGKYTKVAGIQSFIHNTLSFVSDSMEELDGILQTHKKDGKLLVSKHYYSNVL